MKAQMEIFKNITDVFKSKEIEISAQLIAKQVQWEYCRNGEWLPFNMYLNNQLENRFNKKNLGDKIRLLDENNNYIEADVTRLKITYEISNEEADIRRTDIQKSKIHFTFPASWTPGIDLNLVQLDPNSAEYIRVFNIAHSKGLNGVLRKMISIHRVQNRFLYTQYCSLKEHYETKYANKKVEEELFHGTFEDSVANIWKTGFNRSYAGRNATAYGKGVYFAKASSYSHAYTDLNRGKAIGHMFICKVLVGKIAAGSSTMSVPPHNKDTTVNDINNPVIFVIYKDAQAYPEYLLTYV